jgi:biopolymer transport protein ExbD
MIFQRRRKRESRLPEISLTPLIDTALVLLVIFMVATPIMHNSLEIDLPSGQMKESADQNSTSLVVSIVSQDKVQLNGTTYKLENLLTELAKKVAQTKDTRVYIDCDRKVSSGTLVKIIDSIKYVAGVEHVILSTERVR